MTTDDYNAFVDKMNFVPQTREYLTIAFCGEAGEVANEVKKSIRPGAAPRNFEVALELGDTLYYLTAMAKFYGYTLAEIMQLNIDKLERRRVETGVPA